MLLLWIAVGGALGSLARYGLGGWVHGWAGEGFPWGTLGVNTLGCLLIGFAMRAFPGLPISAELRATVTIGFAGGFTTFSTFGWETLALLQRGEWPRALAYGLASVLLGLTAVFAGWGMGGVLLHARG